MLEELYANSPVIFAHRGASFYAPENTLPAFALALEMGAKAIELDAKLTPDGVVYIHHDPTLERTTNGTGKVYEKEWQTLTKLEAGAWKDEKYRGTRIPQLADVFDLVRDKAYINVELTNYETTHDALVVKVIELVQKMKLIGQVFFSSFHPANLQQARKIEPRIPVALLTGTFQQFWLRDAWVSPFLPHPARHVEDKQLSPEFIARQHEQGRKVSAYTVNSPEQMRQFFKWGLDGIFTDKPDIGLQVAREIYSSESSTTRTARETH